MYTQNLTALGFVLLAAFPTFWLLRSLMVNQMGAKVFIFRRNIWIVATVLAFASPSFWIFVPAYIVLLRVVAKREENPVALFFLLMYVAPAQLVQIPPIGSITLIAIDNFMILTLALLLPALMNQRSAAQAIREKVLHKDLVFWVVLFCSIQVLFWMPVESTTHSLRRIVSFILSSVLLYMGCSRLLVTRDQIRDALVCMLLGISLMASVGVVETLKSWHLYRQIGLSWNTDPISTYVFREGALRATGATDTPLMLGQLCMSAVVIAVLMLDRLGIKQRTIGYGAVVVLLAGCYAARSRAPWVTGVVVIVTYLALTPRAVSRLGMFLLVTVLGTGALMLTPFGDKIISFLPYVGSVDVENISYRESMNLALWNLTWKSPWFGNPYFMTELENLRQGQGIIDLLNVYFVFGASFGLPGALSFIICLVLAGRQLVKNIKAARLTQDVDKQRLNACILAMLLGHAFFMSTASFVPTVAAFTWLLCALATSPAMREAMPGTSRAGSARAI